MTELEKARRKFLDECDIVVKVPASWFKRGDNLGFESTLVPLPIYLFLGFKREGRMGGFEIKTRDSKIITHQKDVQPSHMVTPPPSQIDEIRRHLINFYFLEVLENEDSYKEKSKFIDSYELKRMVNVLKEGKIKIWSEIPHFVKLGWADIATAFSVLITCLKNEYSSEEFNDIIKDFKKDVKDTAQMYVPFFNKKDIQNDIIREIFTIAWFMTYGSNGAINFCSLLGGGGQIEATPWRITEIMYRIWVVDDLKWCDRSFRMLWSPYNEKCPKSRPSDFVCCILDALFKPYIHVKIKSLKDKSNIEVLLIRVSEEEEKLLFGPFLMPLLSDYTPDFNIYREPKRKFSRLFPETQIIYTKPFLYLRGPHPEIYDIEKYLKKKGSAICYSSHSMGWEIEGAKLVPPEEYKLISKRREMMTRLKSHIDSKIQSFKEKAEKPKAMAGKKFKILTHDGVEPSDLLPDFEKNMKKYKIWIDRRKPEVKINNKEQKKMEEATQSIDLLTMLLENHGYRVNHETIFNTFDTKGRKYGTGLKRVDWKTCRTESNKMVSELNDRTNHLLERPIKHIESVRKKGYKFILYNAKFCIIYEEEKS